MEIYVAISDFTPPIVDGSQNILEFKKGDEFEIYDSHKTGADWWGARCLKSNSVGYVPSRYMEYQERRVGKLLPTDYTSLHVAGRMYQVYTSMGWQTCQASSPVPRDQKQTSLKRLSDMQNSPDYRSPEEVIPQTPVPDYEEDGQQRSEENPFQFQFAEQFKSVLASINQIDAMNDGQEEPEPDYNDEIDVDTGRPIPRVARPPSTSSEDELIKPKKLANPCIDSKARMAMHKELLTNYKRGVNVLEKPELSKVFSQKRETQKKKDWEAQQKASMKRTSFELKMEQRANKVKEDEEMNSIPEKEERDKPEYEKVFAKITQKANGQVK